MAFVYKIQIESCLQLYEVQVNIVVPSAFFLD